MDATRPRNRRPPIRLPTIAPVWLDDPEYVLSEEGPRVAVATPATLATPDGEVSVLSMVTRVFDGDGEVIARLVVEAGGFADVVRVTVGDWGVTVGDWGVIVDAAELVPGAEVEAEIGTLISK